MFTTTISSFDQYKIVTDNYISIAEKINDQLSYGIGVANLSVAILSVLIAVIAIFVAVVLWKNSREQKENIKEFFLKQEKLIKERNEREDKLIEERREEFETLISEQKTKLKSANQEGKKEIERIISELKREKALINMSVNSIDGYAPLSVTGGFGSNFKYKSIFDSQEESKIFCSKCGKLFKYHGAQNTCNPYAIDISLTKDDKIYCPFCGEANFLQ